MKTDSDTYRVQRLQTWPEVLALENEWRELTAGQPMSVFQGWEWLEAWIRSFGDGLAPYFLRISQDSATVGFIPLVAERVRWRLLPVRQLRLCVNGHSPWGGIVDTRISASGSAAAWKYLANQGDWDVLRLDMVSEGGLGTNFQRDIAQLCRRSLVGRSDQFYVDLTGNWDTYLSTRSVNFRRGLKRTRQKLKEQGTLSIEIADNPETFGDALNEFFSIDRHSWKSRDGEVMTASRALTQYYSDVATNAVERGCGWLVLARVSGTAISAMLCLEACDSVYALKTSFDSLYGSGTVSPGCLVVAAGLEESWRRGLKRFYFLSGNSEWGRWTEQRQSFVSRIIFHPSWYGQGLGMLERIREGLHRRAGWESVWRSHVN